MITCHTLTMAYARVRAGGRLHENLLKRIMRAPMSFFDTTPLGRLVVRFSKDVDTVDVVVPSNTDLWLYFAFGVLATMTVVSYLYCIWENLDNLSVYPSVMLRISSSLRSRDCPAKVKQSMHGLSSVHAEIRVEYSPLVWGAFSVLEVLLYGKLFLFVLLEGRI